jgi:hypothetical protein
MTIQEWYARAVAAGLMPDWKNIIAYWSGDTANVYNDDTDQYIETGIEVDEFDHIQLRSNGKDLYSLEWRKPTEHDIGKMCWFWSYNFITCLSKLHTILSHHACSQNTYMGNSVHACYCLLADHGAIAPTEADFLKAYGE